MPDYSWSSKDSLWEDHAKDSEENRSDELGDISTLANPAVVKQIIDKHAAATEVV